MQSGCSLTGDHILLVLISCVYKLTYCASKCVCVESQIVSFCRQYLRILSIIIFIGSFISSFFGLNLCLRYSEKQIGILYLITHVNIMKNTINNNSLELQYMQITFNQWQSRLAPLCWTILYILHLYRFISMYIVDTQRARAPTRFVVESIMTWLFIRLFIIESCVWHT